MMPPELAPAQAAGAEIILDPHVALAIGLLVLALVIVFGLLLIPIGK